MPRDISCWAPVSTPLRDNRPGVLATHADQGPAQRALIRIARDIRNERDIECDAADGQGEVAQARITSAELVDFSRESVDAALRFGPGKWPGLLADHLFDEWITPVASPLLLQRLGKPRPGNFAGYPLLADPGNRWRDWFTQFGGTPPKRYVASFDDPEMLLKAAVEGMGIAMGRHTMTQPLLDNGRLVSLTTRKMASKYAHYLVYPPRSAELPALIAFREWLLAEVQAEARTLRKPATDG